MADRHAWEDELAEMEIVSLRDEIERLRAALKPFADTLNHIPSMNYRDDVTLSSGWVGAGKLTVGDLRRASAALNEQGGD